MAEKPSRDAHIGGRYQIAAAVVGALLAAVLGNLAPFSVTGGKRPSETDLDSIRADLARASSDRDAARAALGNARQQLDQVETSKEQYFKESNQLRQSLTTCQAAKNPLVPPSPPPAAPPPRIVAKQRLAPIDISLKSCEHAGAGMACSFLVEDTSSHPVYLALGLRDTAVFVEGVECQISEGFLGSKPWTGEQFGAMRLEPQLPLEAVIRFGRVPSSASQGTVRLTLALMQGTGPQAFFGPNPQWQNVMFRNVSFE
jgi:hypothetical protein